MAACGKKEIDEEAMRANQIESLESEMSDLKKRITDIEGANKDMLSKYRDVEKSRAEADALAASKLERLKAGEKQVEGAQQMLCDATGDC